MINRDVFKTAEEFWQLVGKYEPFPRSLEASVARALPIAIVKLPHLGLREIHKWLKTRGLSLNINASDRSLKACLIAQAGRGAIFLDGSDAEDERRFSLAHEIAHFLKDYYNPRMKTLLLYGQEIKDVLDGYRRPTPEERLKGIFRGLSIGTYTNLMDRSSHGYIERTKILESEDTADLLALELLAPLNEVIKKVEEKAIFWFEEAAFSITNQILNKEFGIPAYIADRYSTMIVLGQRTAKSFRDWIGA
jgi:Zn-dependent peptidase ImmA (M78 family)